MSDHPAVYVCVAAEEAWCRTKNAPTYVRNVPAIADRGAQTNAWSLQDFVAAGFKRGILLPAPDLVAANHSDIEIVGAFFAVIKGTSHSSSSVKCHAMICVSDDIGALSLSRDTLSDLGVLSPNFPLIGEHRQSPGLNGTTPDTQQPSRLIRLITGWCIIPRSQDALCSCPRRFAVQSPPQKLPFPYRPKNNAKIKDWLLSRCTASTFNTCPHRALHCMAGPPIEIHVDPSARPFACHSPASIPLHWQEKVYQDLLRDESLGILEKVPHGKPMQWCHLMVITRKHNDTPRRTVDLSPLNKFCKRETFALETPFHLVRRIPGRTWKTVTDAWNEYHSVSSRKSDRHLTTFITPFGRFRCTRAGKDFCHLAMGTIAGSTLSWQSLSEINVALTALSSTTRS